MAEEKVKILLVEDDKFFSEMYATKLEENGFDVETAFNGEDALAKAKELKPKLILLDIVLPKKDGFEVMAEIKRTGLPDEMEIVVLTNLEHKKEVEKGMSLGARDYIIKAHFTPTEVVAKVKKILGI